MGFCLLNNVAIAAAALAERGERVLIVDWDAHHGNGTQDIFYADPRVMYVSMHEYPQYPGTGGAGRERQRGWGGNHDQSSLSFGHDRRRLPGRRRRGPPARWSRSSPPPGWSCRPASTPTGPTR